MILKDIAIILVIIFCVYIFYKGIREKNIIKIIIPLILLIIKARTQIKYIILFILMLLYFVVVGFLPYILGIIIAVITIFLIKKKLVVKNPELNRIVCIVIVVCSFMSFTLNHLWIEYASAIPNHAYIKMKEIDDNQTLVGLTKEQAEELLRNLCGDDRAKITNYITLKNDFYYFQIFYDENGKVKSTSLRLSD